PIGPLLPYPPLSRSSYVEAAMIAQRNQQHDLWARAQINLALLAAESSGSPDQRLEFLLAKAAVEQLGAPSRNVAALVRAPARLRSEEHTSELQSREN